MRSKFFRRERMIFILTGCLFKIICLSRIVENMERSLVTYFIWTLQLVFICLLLFCAGLWLQLADRPHFTTFLFFLLLALPFVYSLFVYGSSGEKKEIFFPRKSQIDTAKPDWFLRFFFLFPVACFADEQRTASEDRKQRITQLKNLNRRKTTVLFFKKRFDQKERPYWLPWKFCPLWW